MVSKYVWKIKYEIWKKYEKKISIMIQLLLCLTIIDSYIYIWDLLVGNFGNFNLKKKHFHFEKRKSSEKNYLIFTLWFPINLKSFKQIGIFELQKFLSLAKIQQETYLRQMDKVFM